MPIESHGPVGTGALPLADQLVPCGPGNGWQEGTAPPSSFQHSDIGVAAERGINYAQPSTGYPLPPPQPPTDSQQVQPFHAVNLNIGRVHNGHNLYPAGQSTH